ncbi:MAG: amidohydrolase family protein [Ilumatobacteraceae bacterium]|jgi:N-acyl-D-amino-acid deacylase|nr:amidohydrolase family protein [Ilumatobacteraceae bacterium]
METPTRTVIQNAHLVDGSGSPAMHADIAFEGDFITEVAAPQSLPTPSTTRVIDADGRLVTPGWVDIHTHYDAQATWDPWLTPSSWHGVTSVVMGNCGVGFAPASSDRHDWLIALMEGVEDIPGTAMTEGITWEWTSFEEYLTALESRPHVIDFAAQIAHGPLRGFVMGDRGAANETATADDIEQMSKLVESALRAGALGFSTSRTPLHRSKDGELVPGTTANEHELLGIAGAMKRVRHGVFQFAPEHAKVPVEEWSWMRKLAQSTGATVSVNLSQPNDGPEIWRNVLSLLTEAQSDGVPIVAQVAGRTIGVLMCLEGSAHPLLFHPAYNEVAHLPLAERCKALQEPQLRERIINEMPNDGGLFQKVILDNASHMFPVMSANIDYEPLPSASATAIAMNANKKVMEILLDQLVANEGHGLIYMPFFNYAYGDLSFNYEAHQHPGTRMGLSDAGAHCGAICDGGTPTFMLTHWVRDRTRGGKLPLELVVHRQTQQTAALYGLTDRGHIAPGKRADINIIDFEKLNFTMPYMAYDLPAQGRRLVQQAIGYDATFVAGIQITDSDQFTGALPGNLVRGPR